MCHVVIRRFAPHADPLILPLATLLSGLGLVLIHRLDLAYAAHYHHATAAASGQLMWCAIAVMVFAAAVALLRTTAGSSAIRTSRSPWAWSC